MQEHYLCCPHTTLLRYLAPVLACFWEVPQPASARALHSTCLPVLQL